MASIEKITRHPYTNNIKKINEVIDELNQLLTSYGTDVWRLDKNINKIAKNTDLNSLITQGTYTCPDATVAATLGHIPHMSSNFRLVVTENISGYISQIVYVYNNAIYMRGRSGGSSPTWTEWHKNAWTDSDITGNAATAAKLKTPVSLQTNLASSSSSSFDGSQGVSFGVTGVLPVSHGGTGKTNLNDVKVGSASRADVAARAEKMEPEVIPANANLNSYTDAGLYYCPKNVDAATVANCPTEGNAFALFVLKNAGVTQLCFRYGTGVHTIWHRNMYSNAWGTWEALVSASDFESLSTTVNQIYKTLFGDAETGTLGLKDELMKSIDEGDFINMAPKIGRYGEDQVQVTASYDISNIEYIHHVAPVMTTDFLDREVMYWVGNGGGPDRAAMGLHKAYKSLHTGEKNEAATDWSWYNYDIVPACFANKNITYEKIYGCDNDYLIVQVKEDDVTKFYRIVTNGNFDEQKWTKCQDITIALSGSKIPGTDISYKRLLHVKFFKSWNTIACVWAISNDILEEDWYYITIWSCTSNVNNTPTFVWGGGFPGLNKTIQLPAGYRFDESSGSVNCLSPGCPTTEACTVIIAETKSTITIVRYLADCYVYQGNARKLTDVSSVPVVLKLNTTSFFNTNKSLTRTITLVNAQGDFIPYDGSDYRNRYLELNSAIAPNTGTMFAWPVNNMSYDTRNGMVYTIGSNAARAIQIRRIALSSYAGTSSENFKYNGLKVAGYVDQFKLPDAAYWGKVFGTGCAMWDQIFISCNNSEGNHFLQIDPNDWQYIKGKTDEETQAYQEALYIEPKPGAPKVVNTSKFSSILNADLVTNARRYEGTDIHNTSTFPYTSVTELNGIVSVKNGTAAEYYKAQYDKTNNKIVWCQYTKTSGADPVEITRTDKTDRTVTGLKGELFNNGSANNTFIYPGFVAYNPMAGMFYIWGIRDDTTWSSNNADVRIPHVVGINASTGAATSFLYNEAASKPSDYKWLDTESGYPSYVTGPTYYTPLLPFGAVVLSATQMIVFFNCQTPGSSRGHYGLLYTFSSDKKTLVSVTKCFTHYSGIAYLNSYGSPNFANMPLMYSGPELGFCGFGETHNGTSYNRDNFKINIRTQYPILGGQSYSDALVKEDLINNVNVYTMFNQSSSGLVANIPVTDIFLGGYYSRLTTARQITGLKANTKNYIFMRRIPGDRTETGIEITSSTVKSIPIGADVFDKICVAVVQTDADKAIKTLQYHVNTGENSWKFKAFSTETYEEYNKDL